MKKILFFDTETTGFPNDYGPLSSQPYIVQIAGMIGEYSDDFSQVVKEDAFDVLFRSAGKIPEQASAIHGITDDMVKDRPMMHEDKFIIDFMKYMDSVDIIVGHNVQFDFKLFYIQVDRLMERFPEKDSKEFKKRCQDKSFCTMQSSIEYCQIPGKYGQFKWPKLMELHTKLFSEGFDAAHNALADITATKKCFFELVRLGIISL